MNHFEEKIRMSLYQIRAWHNDKGRWIELEPMGYDRARQTQNEMNIEYAAEFDKADKELNRVYRKIFAEYADDKVFLEKLKLAQRAWIKFRDAHMESLFPEEEKRLHYGSVYPMCYSIHMKKITEERTRQLKVWLEGIEEGDVCSGSVKVK